MADIRCNLARNGRTRRGQRAFTLVELLVVMFVLGILASLVVGVSVYIMDKVNRDQTLANQQIIINAIDNYFEIMDAYPPETDTELTDPNLTTDLEAHSSQVLAHTLMGQTCAADVWADRIDGKGARIRSKIRPILLELPEEAMDTFGFRDAYDQLMKYQPTGGLGGTPVVISAGGDGKFDAPDDGDNIRSDNR